MFKITSQFPESQLKIIKKLLKIVIPVIATTVQRLKMEQLTHCQFSFIQCEITQIITAFQIIHDILEITETAITFSKLNTLHISIIERTNH